MLNANTPSRVAKLIEKRISDLQARKSQKDIAREAGFANPNIMSMLKMGTTKLALDRVPGMARALEVDPAHLFRLALEQFFEGHSLKAINDIFSTVVSANEARIVEVIREASGNTDPSLTPAMAEKLSTMFAPAKENAAGK